MAARGGDRARDQAEERPVYSAERYTTAQPFLSILRRYYLNRKVTGAEYKELREKALQGHVTEARIKLWQIVYDRI